MRELLHEVLDLQQHYSPQSTDHMLRRGALVRSEMAAWLRTRLPELATPTLTDLAVDASDGVGLRNEIPWARVHSASRSPKATQGWYVVYLFDAPGEHVFLTLMQGTTTWVGETAHTRPLPELRARSTWARTTLAKDLAARPDVLPDIRLRGRTSKRARGYEAGTVAALRYDKDDLPNDETLAQDLTFMVRVLDTLHHVDSTTEDDPPAEVTEAVDAADRTAGRRGRGQGTGLSAPDRRAIELRAVELATAHLHAHGYTTTDVGATESYDIDARRPHERVYVEVKGTMSPGEEVILTKNEVDLNAAKYPNTMLIIAAGITLDRSVTPPLADGGTLRDIHPWLATPASLTPISYRYQVG